MKKINNKRGFTMAELLIVVAIIAVLVAVAMPTFAAELEKANQATDAANLRAAYAEVIAAYLSGSGNKEVTVTLVHTATATANNKLGEAKIGTLDWKSNGLNLSGSAKVSVNDSGIVSIVATSG